MKVMEKVSSFMINHNTLLRGIYVSRKDSVGTETITTFDIRMKEPNREPVMSTKAIHTIEHLGATFLRNHPVFAKKTIYFGPMGCRTGFYMLLKGNFSSEDILPIVVEMFEFIANFDGKIPGSEPRDCGNALEHDLGEAKEEAKKFLQEILLQIKKENLVYPE